MSSEQGPRLAGMRASANVAGRRQDSVSGLFDLAEAAQMSSEQATAERSIDAIHGKWLPCMMFSSHMRPLAPAPLPDPAARVPRATLRGAPREAGMRAGGRVRATAKKKTDSRRRHG